MVKNRRSLVCESPACKDPPRRGSDNVTPGVYLKTGVRSVCGFPLSHVPGRGSWSYPRPATRTTGRHGHRTRTGRKGSLGTLDLRHTHRHVVTRQLRIFYTQKGVDGNKGDLEGVRRRKWTGGHGFRPLFSPCVPISFRLLLDHSWHHSWYTTATLRYGTFR